MESPCGMLDMFVCHDDLWVCGELDIQDEDRIRLKRKRMNLGIQTKTGIAYWPVHPSLNSGQSVFPTTPFIEGFTSVQVYQSCKAHPWNRFG
jgi:hypothetical protein